MPQFLTTSGTSHLIEDVIIKAKTDLVLITPYLKLSRILFERLTEANRRGVRIRLVYGKSELHPNEQKQLDALTNIELLFLQNLHAKCYLNENVLVVSSMNLYEFSEKNNREMGIVLTRQDDGECFADALAEAHSIMAAAQVVSVRKPALETRAPSVVDQRNVTKASSPPAMDKRLKEMFFGKAPYDSARMTQLLYEQLKQQPGLRDMFSIATEPHYSNKDKLVATIIAKDYPRRGIHFTFKETIRFDFDESDKYQAVKSTQRDQVEKSVGLGGDYRCYWNQDVLQIYAAKNHESIDEQATADYFLKAIVSAAGVLKWYPNPVRAQRS
jgi:PLD-like domain